MFSCKIVASGRHCVSLWLPGGVLAKTFIATVITCTDKYDYRFIPGNTLSDICQGIRLPIDTIERDYRRRNKERERDRDRDRDRDRETDRETETERQRQREMWLSINVLMYTCKVEKQSYIYFCYPLPPTPSCCFLFSA